MKLIRKGSSIRAVAAASSMTVRMTFKAVRRAAISLRIPSGLWLYRTSAESVTKCTNMPSFPPGIQALAALSHGNQRGIEIESAFRVPGQAGYPQIRDPSYCYYSRAIRFV